MEPKTPEQQIQDFMEHAQATLEVHRLMIQALLSIALQTVPNPNQVLAATELALLSTIQQGAPRSTDPAIATKRLNLVLSTAQAMLRDLKAQQHQSH